MITKISCQHCDQNIEFEAEDASDFIHCPSCGKQSRRFMPGTKIPPQKVNDDKTNKPVRLTPIVSSLFWWGSFIAFLAGLISVYFFVGVAIASAVIYVKDRLDQIERNTRNGDKSGTDKIS
jgi:hypothetical protein